MDYLTLEKSIEEIKARALKDVLDHLSSLKLKGVSFVEELNPNCLHFRTCNCLSEHTLCLKLIVITQDLNVVAEIRPSKKDLTLALEVLPFEGVSLNGIKGLRANGFISRSDSDGNWRDIYECAIKDIGSDWIKALKSSAEIYQKVLRTTLKSGKSDHKQNKPVSNLLISDHKQNIKTHVGNLNPKGDKNCTHSIVYNDDTMGGCGSGWESMCKKCGKIFD